MLKKVLFVIGIMGNGGAERVIASLSNELVKNNVDVGVITIYGDRQDYELNPNIKLIPICCSSKIRFFRPIERVQSIRKTVIDFKPDCIISFLVDVNIHTILSTIGLNIPVIVSERNDPCNDPGEKYKRILRDNLYKKADGIVFQTKDARDYFNKIITNGIKTTIISNPLTPNLPSYYGTKENNFITACRLNSQKNLWLMIDAIQNVLNSGRECSLKIYGEGSLRKDLQKYIDKKRLCQNIKLMGFSKNIHNEMKRSKGFLITSDYEGISNSMLEALAIGIPVVATDCPAGGARMFIRNHVNGFLVPVRDCDAVTDSIEWIIDHGDEAVELGKKATEIKKQLDVSVITKQWLCFIDKVMKG